jgi:phosphoribosylformylglycinamidine synthase I
MNFAVLQFPASNCDQDALHVVRNVLGTSARFVWHKENSLGGVDAVIIPGGFSYGDYLRTGAIARFSPIMQAVREFAGKGGPVLGICNGFQILCEAGLLPGALIRNRSLQFRCEHIFLKTVTRQSPFTSKIPADKILRLPEGANPNGSLRNIAGICNEARNVAGLMPHPERASESILGSTDGRLIFEGLAGWLESRLAQAA